MNQNILVLGDDPRQLYLKTLFDSCSDDYPLSPQEIKFREHYQIIVLPVPTTQEMLVEADRLGNSGIILFGGSISAAWKEHFQVQNIRYCNYMASECSAMLNAVSTAEGILAEVIISSPDTIQGSNCLITGFGRCWEVLALKLKALNATVYVKTRNASAQAKAEAFGLRTQITDYGRLNYIFNTAPGPAIQKEMIDQFSPDVMIFDIASKPGGTDFKYCGERGISARLYPGLPAKYAPAASAKIIYQEIKHELSEMEVSYES